MSSAAAPSRRPQSSLWRELLGLCKVVITLAFAFEAIMLLFGLAASLFGEG